MTSHEDPRPGRIDRLRQYIEQDHQTGVLVSRPEHVRYLTGCSQEYPTYLVLTASRSVLVLANDLAGSAPDLETIGIEIAPYVAYSAEALPDPQAAADERVEGVVGTALRRGAFEADHLGAGLRRRLNLAESLDVGPAIRSWRRTKDVSEVEAIRSTVRAVEDSFDAVRQVLQPGISEATIAGTVYEELVARAREPFRFGFVIAGGARSAEPTPRPGTSHLREGDMVVVDLYPVLNGYAADLTRTFVIGEPPSLLRQRHQLVAAALREAERHLRSGTTVADIDRILRGALPAAEGLRASMRHHSGHGLGLSEWEEPWIGPDTPGAILKGDVVAIEPGVYVPGWGGIRLESNYHITDSGFDRLDTSPLDIQS
jgi:Xaa-Pro aminopeptidase